MSVKGFKNFFSTLYYSLNHRETKNLSMAETCNSDTNKIKTIIQSNNTIKKVLDFMLNSFLLFKKNFLVKPVKYMFVWIQLNM